MNNLEAQLLEAKLQSIFLADKIAKIEIQLIKNKNNVWRPNIGEEYFRVTDIGHIEKYINKNDEIDLAVFALNAYYQTLEEAESELNARQVKAELEKCDGAKKFIYNNNNFSFVFDDSKFNKKDWFISPYGDFQVYFDNQDQLDAAELKVGAERILKAMRWIHLGKEGF